MHKHPQPFDKFQSDCIKLLDNWSPSHDQHLLYYSIIRQSLRTPHNSKTLQCGAILNAYLQIKFDAHSSWSFAIISRENILSKFEKLTGFNDWYHTCLAKNPNLISETLEELNAALDKPPFTDKVCGNEINVNYAKKSTTALIKKISTPDATKNTNADIDDVTNTPSCKT